ncbi:IPT/TIG domain-containing protein [Myxococcus fulvus]|uniref:IPT/TIG domain-containing protein n=1 Tax=Myxococcus fulvus TaxID=33 RepID=A0A511T9Y4_MYXFU|nr:IPT/TIG domain-containing protein [Myxococcus fulvus]GEN10991.1 hypothetical protein MFU01_60280 [Myxococcus fulvus]SET38961.1 IPT/TIG domain-containing protein [Myxococcus fulvus]
MSRCLRSLLLVLPLLAVACGDDKEGNQPSEQTAPTVREITPSGGPIAGNTLINVYGSGFKDGAKLYLGEQEALRVVVVNAFRIYGYSPTATTAQVDVRVVNPDGAYGVLVKGFTYEGPPGRNIDQAEVINGNTEAVSGGQPVGVLVRGAITVAGLTRGVGQGGGVRAQVGFAPADSALLQQDSYTWEEATYEGDSDSGEADIYKGNVLLQPAIGGESREWVITIRFSIDGGTTWVMADGDGMANGVAENMLRRVFISRPRVDYCKLGPDGNRANPELFYRPTDTTLLKVAGQVYAAGITQGAGAGSGLVAQLGYGPVDSDPRDSAAWTWIPAVYKAEHGNNDEWEAELPNPGTEGQYKLAFRFSISENAWRVCDADGVNDSTEGELTFSLAKLGTLTVGTEAPKPPVSWCKIGEDQKDPEVINYQTTQTSGFKTVYAQVHMPGVTDKVGAGPGLSGQLGWGPAGEDPRTSQLWNWSTALAFNKDNFQVNDEWKATLPNPGTNGEYRYAVRFSGNGGPVRVCDGNGVDDGGQEFELDKLGQLTVTGEVVVPKVIGFCKLGPSDNPNPETVTYAAGAAATRKVLAQVFVQGVTTGAGAGTGIVGQLGWGPAGENPATSAQWNWATTAAYKDESGNNDQFETTLPNPGAVGSYRFTYRFKVNDGAYLLCDSDGNSGGATGFDPTKTGTLTVSAAQDISVNWCKLGGESNGPPPSEVYQVGQAPIDIYAQVYMEGVTPGTGGGTGIQGEVGYGPETDEPTAASWQWTTTGVAFNRESGGGNNDEWKAALPNPGTVGRYKFAIRFNVNGGAYRYCDADGLDNGFTLEQAGTLTVQAPTAADFCRLQSVSGTTVGSGDAVSVTGRVRLAGVTNGAGAGTGLQVQVGLGNADVDASTTPASFTWKAATYAREAEGEADTDEFTAELRPAYTTARAVSLRYSTDGSAWTYCDKDGSDVGGYSQGQQHALTVGNHSGIDYCRLQWPRKLSDLSGNRTMYGFIYEDGVTNAPPPATTLTAELGHGPKDQDPGVSTAWTWVAGTVNSDQNGDDEYKADLPANAALNHGYVWRFRVATGPYCYGDWQEGGVPGGSTNGLAPEDMGTVDVAPAP